MNYDFEKIGQRIREERKKQGKTQAAFAADFEVKKSTVSRWENGEAMPSFQTLLDMCKAFDCEAGYLLCEDGYENKTRAATDICKATGLSEEAVKRLCDFQKTLQEYNISPSKRMALPQFTSFFLENESGIYRNIEDLEIHEQNLKELKNLDDYELIEKAFYKAEQGKRFNLFREATTEDYFYSLLERELLGESTDTFTDTFSISSKTDVMERLKNNGFSIERLNNINRSFGILEMRSKEKYFKFELSDNFMDIVKAYVKEGVENGGKN